MRSIACHTLVALLLVGCATTDVLSDGTVSSGDDGVRPEGGTGGDGASSSVGANGGNGAGGVAPCEDGEICGDGIDNDCNGTADDACDCTPGDTMDCTSGDPAMAGIGECAFGTATCDDNGKWLACEGEILPTAEDCNGLDENCDGEEDDGFGSITCGVGLCTNTIDECVAGILMHCEPLPPPDAIEDCDGTDDDCDGDTDEGCTCTNGATQTCYGGPMGTAGTGACASGTQTCTGGQWGACNGEVLPGTEACDNIDQDCDGNISEGMCSSANAVAACQNGACVISSCSPGFSNCDANGANGCETDHHGHSNSAPGENLGSIMSDAVFGLGCLSGGACDGPLIVEQGTKGRHFTIAALEESACCSYVGMRFELVVPAGADYDLFLSGNGCQVDPAWSSVNGTGNNEVISVWCNDDCGGVSNSFNVSVEVRYWSGASCEPWTLNVYAGAC